MKNYSPFKLGGNLALLERKRWSDVQRAKGTGQIPMSPQTLHLVSQVGIVTLSWSPPRNSNVVIKGWRIYQDDEKHLIQTIRDPARTTTTVLPLDNAVHNYFVSAVTAAEVESPKVQVQGKAL